MKNHKTRTLVTCLTVFLVLAGSISAAIAVHNHQKAEAHQKLVGDCLVYVGFYSGEYSENELVYLALGCERWAKNQE